MSVEIISEYWSDDGKLKADVVVVDNDGLRHNMVYFYVDGQFVGSETYEGRSIHYYEDAAENYVLGVKTLDHEGK